MIKKIKLIFLALCTAFANVFIPNTDSVVGSANPSNDGVYDIVLFWGQSNMVGSCCAREETTFNRASDQSINNFSNRSKIDTDILRNNVNPPGGSRVRNYVKSDIPSGVAYEYMFSSDNFNEINASYVNLGENLGYKKDSNGNLIGGLTNQYGNGVRYISKSKGTNMIPEFCSRYYKNTGHKVIVVFAANEGRKIGEFSSNSNPSLYKAIQEKYQKALKKIGSLNLNVGTRLYVVLQGESDIASGKSKDDYYNSFMNFHNSLTKNDPNFKIQKGAIVLASREANLDNRRYNISPASNLKNVMKTRVNNVVGAQKQLINNNNDIILGSSFFYDSYYGNNSNISENDKLLRGKSIADYNPNFKVNGSGNIDSWNCNSGENDDNSVHLRSIALAQIGRQVADSYANVIDHVSPNLNIVYSTLATVKENVTVTISSNEELRPLAGWNLSSDSKSISKLFSSNYNGNIAVHDLAGNISTINVSINNIDTAGPSLNVVYNPSNSTNGSVTATISSNERIKKVSGWTLSSNNKSISKKFTKNTSESVIVYDLVGNSTTIKVNVNNIDVTKPKLTVSYNPTTKTKENVIAKISANEKIKPISGWNLSSDGKSLTRKFTSNYNGNLVVYDLAGNQSNVSIKITNISNDTPSLKVSYSTKNQTNKNVVVTINSSKKIKNVSGWTLSSNGKKLTKTFTSNYAGNVTVFDDVGNQSIAFISIENIDKVKPKLDVKYSTTVLTNKDVVVTITANESIQNISGWDLSGTSKVLTKKFNSNYKGNITITDLAGNTNIVSINISNIDKKTPSLKVNYSTKKSTKKSVVAKIKSNKKIKNVEGWKLSEDGKELSKEFSSNYSGTLNIYDYAGNKSSVSLKINNIDNSSFNADVNYSTTMSTKNDVLVTINSSKELNQLEGWILSNDKKTLSKYYSDNVNEKVIVKSSSGDSIEKTINIDNIDKAAPVVQTHVVESPENHTYTVVVVSSEKVKPKEGWVLSKDEKTLTKEYSDVSQDEVLVTDLAGNEQNLKIDFSKVEKNNDIIKENNNISTTESSSYDNIFSKKYIYIIVGICSLILLITLIVVIIIKKKPHKNKYIQY